MLMISLIVARGEVLGTYVCDTQHAVFARTAQCAEHTEEPLQPCRS